MFSSFGNNRKRKYKRKKGSNNDNNKRCRRSETPPPQKPPPYPPTSFGSLFEIILNPPHIPPLKNNGEEDDKTDDNDYFETDDKLYEIEMKIETLDDIIKLGESYDPESPKKYVINLKTLNRCVPALKELQAMIGMKSIKQSILELFFFHLQNFLAKENKIKMMHTIIEGPPGSGKTEVAKILAKIYQGLRVVKNDKFIMAKRSDLIGAYIGHTEKQTQAIFNKAVGGVLFIDEAYSIGNSKERPDSFSKACVDLINQNLTEMDVTVMLGGYKKQLKETFFSHNPGLMRRFPYRFSTDKYTPEDLKKIYEKMVGDDKWTLSDDDATKVKVCFFKKNYDYFPYSGGDMETLWSFTKIAHAKRVFGKDPKLRKVITQEDLDGAFKMFASNSEVKSRANKFDYIGHLYV